jgi:hypothetical protein
MRLGGTRAVAALLLTGQAACLTGPRLVNAPPKDYLVANQPERVWATLSDGERLVIDGATVVSDTVFGFAQSGQGVVIPASNLQEIRVRKISLLKSAIIPAGLATGAVALFVLIKSSTEVPDPVDTVQSSVPDPYANRLIDPQ